MHDTFRTFTENLHPKFEALMRMAPAKGVLPYEVRGSGIYLFSEEGRHLYVGRTRDVRRRYGQHSRPSSKHNTAPFAFKLAREATGILLADYTAGGRGRVALSAEAEFSAAFATALARVRNMEFRFVEEPDPTRQCLLEVYVSVVHSTPYNDFDTH
ncbi:GIY-YIG catalytic domain protein [compost metagenome]